MSFADAESGPRSPMPSPGRDRASGVRIREVESGEPVPLWGESSVGRAGLRLSRAMPRYAGAGSVAFLAECEGQPLAVVSGASGLGRETVTVQWVRREAADVQVMARLFTQLERAASARGAKWLRWRLTSGDLPLLDAIRKAVGVPVLHREGDDVIAEISVDPRWRSR
jgi:hypothetical protein